MYLFIAWLNKSGYSFKQRYSISRKDVEVNYSISYINFQFALKILKNVCGVSITI